MKQQFIEKNFSQRSWDTIEQANEIIEDYAEQGFSLTLRQLYYQFVSRGLMDNKQAEYKRLGSVLSDARLAGLVDWAAIEDRTRFVRSDPHWETASSYIQAEGFNVDKWENQKYRLEVWIEKDALVGVKWKWI